MTTVRYFLSTQVARINKSDKILWVKENMD